MIYQLNQPYLIEASLILAIGYLVYSALFSEDKNFIRNRIYLLILTMFSFVLPLVSFPVFVKEVMLSPVRSAMPTPTIHASEVVNSLEWITLLQIIYLSVAVLLAIRLIYHISYIVRVISTSESLTRDHIKYVITDKLSSPASIFDRLIVDRVDIPQEIIAHENVHITHGHTWDILLMEIAKIILWFNPFIYFTAQALKNNHEFTADQLAAQSLENELDYSSILIQYAKSTKAPILLNTFSTITKKRIIMLSKEKSNNNWKSFLVIPVLCGIACLFSFDTYNVHVSSGNYVAIDSIPETRIDTVMAWDDERKEQILQIERVYPNDIRTWIDTTVIFDSDTGEEKVQIVKSEYPRTEVLQQTYTNNEFNRKTGNLESRTFTRYPQEMVRVTDTLTTFDYDTYEETVTIIEGSRARVELISTKVTPKNELEKVAEFDRVIEKKSKVTIKKKGN